MLESGLSGSVRGVPSNGHPYRDPGSFSTEMACPCHVCFPPIATIQRTSGEVRFVLFRKWDRRIQSLRRRAPCPGFD